MNDTEIDSKKMNKNSHEKQPNEKKTYLRFAAMIVTSMVIMYAVTYMNTYALSHIMWSETRLFMTLLMGATMAVVMLGFMMNMYKNQKINVGIVLGSLLLFILGTWLVRSQNTVGDNSYMSAMIPHHSIAILTSEKANIEDVRVCELAKEIIEAQQKEIDEMKWLIDDIDRNGPVTTQTDAERRAAPEYSGESIRNCS